MPHHERLVLAASLNKSFATSGGALVFPNEELRQRVRACGPTLIFAGPIQPPMLAAANQRPVALI
jgi:7-keto-8-aminopelargonate synthetase-like enzyme